MHCKDFLQRIAGSGCWCTKTGVRSASSADNHFFKPQQLEQGGRYPLQLLGESISGGATTFAGTIKFHLILTEERRESGSFLLCRQDRKTSCPTQSWKGLSEGRVVGRRQPLFWRLASRYFLHQSSVCQSMGGRQSTDQSTWTSSMHGSEIQRRDQHTASDQTQITADHVPLATATVNLDGLRTQGTGDFFLGLFYSLLLVQQQHTHYRTDHTFQIAIRRSTRCS